MTYQFDSLKPELIKQRKAVHQVCRNYRNQPDSTNFKKLKSLFSACGQKVFIEPGFYCDYGDKITIGHNVFFNINATLLDGGKIAIGDDCLIGPNVQILTINHATNPTERLKKENFADDVLIGNNVWIGAGAIILPGVTIADGCVIAAGSVVTKSTEANSLYAGNPAKFKKYC
ncbi:MAG: sugar O-acetyltransferase [Gammaproteobacteria bacterium]|nr:sugar O-acetyltransferase [Gammaproteobacteria bacterium]MDH5629114.1 sugar O-acetyltransferase [Gammaproteobacteria bacterium]